MNKFGSVLKLAVTLLVLGFAGFGVYSLVSTGAKNVGFSLPTFGRDNAVIFLRNQTAKGRVIKVSGREVTLQKDKDSYKFVVPEKVLIMKNLVAVSPKMESTSSAVSFVGVPNDKKAPKNEGPIDPLAITKATFEDIKVGKELNVYFEWVKGEFVVKNVVIES